MANRYLFCIDIDGTLLDGISKIPPQENIRAIQEARSQGHVIYINTGRSWSNIPNEIRNTLQFMDGICCANGSYIRTNDQVHKNEILPKHLVKEFLHYFLFEDDRFCLFEGVEALIKTRESSRLYGNPGVLIQSMEELTTKFNDPDFNVFSCEGQLPQSFRDHYCNLVNIFQCDTFADCIPLGCTKATGLQFVADLHGIEYSNTVAIGDSANDLPMLRAAGIAVAMGNASPDVKAEASFITDSNKEFGVASAIRKILSTI